MRTERRGKKTCRLGRGREREVVSRRSPLVVRFACPSVFPAEGSLREKREKEEDGDVSPARCLDGVNKRGMNGKKGMGKRQKKGEDGSMQKKEQQAPRVVVLIESKEAPK